MKRLFLILVFLSMTNFVFAESYRTLNNGYIQRQSDLALIPPTLENKDYVQYLADKKAGAEVKLYDYEAENQRQITEQAKIKTELDKEKLIQDKIREQAIIALKAEGKIDPNDKIK